MIVAGVQTRGTITRWETRMIVAGALTRGTITPWESPHDRRGWGHPRYNSIIIGTGPSRGFRNALRIPEIKIPIWPAAQRPN